VDYVEKLEYGLLHTGLYFKSWKKKEKKSHSCACSEGMCAVQRCSCSHSWPQH